jgi:zinc protease
MNRNALAGLARRRLTRRRLLSSSAAALGLAFAPRLLQHTTADIPRFQQVLPNGLTVVVEERPSADVVALQHTALAGVRDDGDRPGITVLTSRMLLAGTPTRPTDIAMRAAATLAGGTISRGTTVEASSITIVMPADAAELAFDLASDAVINPLFSANGLLSQLEVALQGLAQRRTTAGILIDDLFQQSLFAGQPLGFPPLGNAASLQSLSTDDLQANWQRLWGASNSVVTVAGRIHAADALGQASQYFGGLFAGNPNVRVPTQTTKPAAKVVQGTAGQQQQFRIGFLAPSLQSDDRYPTSVLTGMMSGFSGRLVRELRTLRGISYTPSAAFLAFSDAGEWYATASVDPDKLDEALSVTRDQIQKLVDEPASSSEVSDAIEAIAGEEVLATESNEDVARRMAAEQILGEVTAEEFVRRVRTVTPDDVQRIARTYLNLDHSLTVLVGPPTSS